VGNASNPGVDLELLSRRLRSPRLISYDAETNGLDWREHHIVGHVFTFGPGDSLYIPIRHATGNNNDPSLVNDCIRDGFRNPNLRVVAHNALFDLKFLAKDGIEVAGPVYDTQTMAALANEHEAKFSLEWLAATYKCNVQKRVNIYEYIANKFVLPTKDKNVMGKFWCLDAQDTVAHEYAMSDGEATLQLYGKLLSEIEDQQLDNTWRIESQLTKVLHQMSWRGVKVDEERLSAIKKEAEANLDKCRECLPKDLNFRSPLQMEKLFTEAGIRSWPRTKTGRPSFPEVWLKTTEVGRRVVAARKWETALSSFINPLIDRHVYKGRAHTNYHQLRADEYGTISGRLSATDPNFFNYPSPKRQPEMGKLIRQAFVPDDGFQLVEADLEQCEPKLIAHFAQIKEWIRGYNANPPLDSHTMVAQMANIDRQPAKTINMAIVTGAGNEKLSMMIGLGAQRGMEILNAYHESVPEIKRFQNKAKDRFRQRGYVKSLLGRRFRLDDPRFAYRALSRIIQGSNADIIKAALVEAARVEGAQVLNSIYDSIMWQDEGPGAARDAIVHSMTTHVNNMFNLSCPMTVELGAGTRWSEC
jgi:DNA polymerase-1